MKNDKLIKVFLIIIVLLLSGSIIGFLCGGKIMQDQWSSFYEAKSKEIEKYCVCSYPGTLEEYVLDTLNLTTPDE